jgi:hypothetical protein
MKKFLAVLMVLTNITLSPAIAQEQSQTITNNHDRAQPMRRHYLHE